MSKNQEQYANLSDLTESPWNPNEVDPINQEKLINSIKTVGIFKPIIVRTLDDDSLQIIGGQHRARALRSMGEAQVWIKNLGKITDEQAKKIALIDNSQYGELNNQLFADLVGDGELGSLEDILNFLPMEQDELINIFDHSSTDFDSLEMEFDDDDDSIDLEPLTSPSTNKSQILRFKVPQEDAHIITDCINRVKAEQGYTESDELTNAGDALIHFFKETL